jgi:predicted NBD/HSP70 family sugar kinase
LAVDLRPNVTTVAVSDVNGRFLSQQAIATPADPVSAGRTFAEKMLVMMEGHRNLVFEGIGISVPGRFDEHRQRVVFAPNLRWPEFDLKTPLEKATGLQVELENAANACVLAEAWFGQAEKPRNLVVVTVAEGIGVGIFSDGHLLHGARGMAGEFGHVTLDDKGPQCGCGGYGCWEVFASNWAALRYYHAAIGSDGPSFQDLVSLAEGGDRQALRALDRMAQEIGRGMRTVIVALAPEEIVLVGEFARLWKHMGPVIEDAVSKAVLVGKPPRVRPASAEPSVARLRGTVALVLQKHFGSAVEQVRQLPEQDTAVTLQ